MRIATWNCQGGLDKKMDVVAALAADVLIVQECASSTGLSSADGISSVWAPPYEGAIKGTGVFARGDWRVEAADPIQSLPWVLPVTVTNRASGFECSLLAVWTNKNKDDGRPAYAEQFGAVLDHFADSISDGSTLIAGDVNGSMQGPDIAGHARNLDRLGALGLVSAYHHANGVGHGDETDMTLKWIGPERREFLYHCDFIFVPERFTSGMTSRVVNTFDWPTRVSDHQPVVVDLTL